MLFRKYKFILIMLVVYSPIQMAHGEPFINTQPTEATTTTLTLTDIAVINAVATDSLTSSSRPDPFVAILTECQSGEIKFTPLLPAFLADDRSTATHAQIGRIPVDTSVVENLVERNVRVFQMKKRVEGESTVIIGSTYADELMAKGRFRREFPSTREVLRLWLPGYNEEKTKALLYAFTYDDFGSTGYVFQLNKERDRWSVIATEIAFILDTF